MYVQNRQLVTPPLLYALVRFWSSPQSVYTLLTFYFLLKLKKMLNDVLYVCGNSFREYEEEPVAYFRKNIRCPTNIETPYHSIENLRKICICFV